jgi:hypothetical protein
LYINGTIYGDDCSLSVVLVRKLLYKIQDLAVEKNNRRIASIIDTIIDSYEAEEKDAYAVAAFADANGIIDE